MKPTTRTKRRIKRVTTWKGAGKQLLFIGHDQDKKGDFTKRALMHIPVGLVAGIPILGYPVMKLFIFYEDNEDLHIKDEAWKDTFGAVIGATITALAALGVGIWLGLR